MPHMVRGEQQRAALERVEQRERDAFADERRHRIHFNHWQLPARGGDGVILAGVSLLPNLERGDLYVPSFPVDNRRHGIIDKGLIFHNLTLTWWGGTGLCKRRLSETIAEKSHVMRKNVSKKNYKQKNQIDKDRTHNVGITRTTFYRYTEGKEA